MWGARSQKCKGALWFPGHWLFGNGWLDRTVHQKPLQSQARQPTRGWGAETRTWLMRPREREAFSSVWCKDSTLNIEHKTKQRVWSSLIRKELSFKIICSIKKCKVMEMNINRKGSRKKWHQLYDSWMKTTSLSIKAVSAFSVSVWEEEERGGWCRNEWAKSLKICSIISWATISMEGCLDLQKYAFW